MAATVNGGVAGGTGATLELCDAKARFTSQSDVLLVFASYFPSMGTATSTSSINPVAGFVVLFCFVSV